MPTLPLDGVRIVDFTRVQAGPQATHWLAVMGAEVIKIESRQRPDLLRLTFARSWATEPNPNKSSVFLSLNCSKKSCTLNLTQPRAAELAKELIKRSDVVVENYATGVMERFGLGYYDLRKLKPDLIMASVSGPGRTGPEKDYVAFAPTINALSGLSSLTGYLDGPPNLMGGMWGDVLAAQTAAFAIVSALHHRSRTGKGQHIDVSMTEAVLAMLPEAVTDYTMNKRVRGPVGNRDDIMAPHGCYRCRGDDKWVAIAVATEEEWQSLCQAMGDPDWTREERFSDMFSRWQNQDQLDPLIEEWTKGFTPYEVMELLQKVGVAAGPSANVEEVLNDPHLRERGFFVELDHPELGEGLLARVPWKLGDTPQGNYEPAPLLGEHNDYVFHELLGMSEEEISRLVEEKVIY